MADEIAILIPDEAITARLLAVNAPQHLPPALQGAWLTMAEAKPPVLEDANLLVNGTTIRTVVVAAGRTDLHTYAYFFNPLFKDGTLHATCCMPGCLRDESFKMVEHDRVVMGNVVRHLTSKACPRAILSLKDLMVVTKGAPDVRVGIVAKLARVEVEEVTKYDQLEIFARGLTLATMPFGVVDSEGFKYILRALNLETITGMGVTGAFKRIFQREVVEVRAFVIAQLSQGAASYRHRS